MNTPSKEVIDIFTKVTKHLLTQNAKAESFNKKTQHTDCCYLTPTGLKCAIGCLIKSDCYDPAIEGCTVSILHQDTPVSSKRQEAFRKVFECSQIPTSLDAIQIWEKGILVGVALYKDTSAARAVRDILNRKYAELKVEHEAKIMKYPVY